MHLVFLNQYYPPDVAPTGVMLEGLVQGMLESGHEVTVLCAAGGYAESGASVSARRYFSESVGSKPARTTSETPKHRNTGTPHIYRIRASRCGRGTFIGKLVDYASYYLGTGWKLLTLRPQPNRIVALTTPPYLSVLARVVSKVRGADHAHWVMDLYPDVMASHGMLAETGLVYRILASLTRFGFGGKRCAAVVTLGPDMAERVGRMVVSCRLSVGGEKMGSEIGDRGSEIVDRKSEIEDHALHPHATPDTPTTDNRQPTTDNGNVCWVPLWSAEDVVAGPSLALRRQRGWGDDELVVMYSGNMGLGHRFAEILVAAKTLAEGRVAGDGRADRPRSADLSPAGQDDNVHAYSSSPQGDNHGAPGRHALPTTDNRQLPTIPPTRLVFYGGGKRRDEVAKFISENPGCAVEMHDYAPAELLTTHLQSADVHLASLDAAWTGTMVPSKLQGIFAAGRPVIFIGSPESSIGRWVLASGGGWVLLPGDVAGLLATLAAARDPAIRLPRGRAAKSFADAHFNKTTNVARLVKVFELPRLTT